MELGDKVLIGILVVGFIMVLGVLTWGGAYIIEAGNAYEECVNSMHLEIGDTIEQKMIAESLTQSVCEEVAY